MRPLALLAGLVVLAAVIGGMLLVARPPVSVASASDADVTIECDAGTGLSADQCRSWGDATLAAGPPSATFEMDDVARLELTRSLFGLGSECSAVYAIERYPDRPAWTEPVDCP